MFFDLNMNTYKWVSITIMKYSLFVYIYFFYFFFYYYSHNCLHLLGVVYIVLF